jgi:hypothetical protein
MPGITVHAQTSSTMPLYGEMRALCVKSRGCVRRCDRKHRTARCPNMFQPFAAGDRHGVRAAAREPMFDREFPDASGAHKDCVAGIGARASGGRLGWSAIARNAMCVSTRTGKPGPEGGRTASIPVNPAFGAMHMLYACEPCCPRAE